MSLFSESEKKLVKKLLESDEGWSPELNKEKVQVFTQKISVFSKATSVDAVKLVAHIPHSFEIVNNIVRDVSLRKMIADNTKESRWIENDFPGKNRDVIYLQIQPPTSLVSIRDLVVQREWESINDGTGYIWFTKSVEHPKMGPQSGIVRAQVLLQALEIKQDPKNPEHTLYVFINQMELGGWIPSSVIHFVQKTFAESIVGKLEQGMEKACKLLASQQANSSASTTV